MAPVESLLGASMEHGWNKSETWMERGTFGSMIGPCGIPGTISDYQTAGVFT